MPASHPFFVGAVPTGYFLVSGFCTLTRSYRYKSKYQILPILPNKSQFQILQKIPTFLNLGFWIYFGFCSIWILNFTFFYYCCFYSLYILLYFSVILASFSAISLLICSVLIRHCQLQYAWPGMFIRCF